MDQHQSLKKFLISEYEEASQRKINLKQKSLNNKLRIIRIFISSTFRDFHNERDLLVTNVFPRLRRWCANRGLYLVECDLRWGIPSDSTEEETLQTCLAEIERGRKECNDMNFFLGLIGDRYGWIPSESEITDKIREKYNWIDGSSVTLMEFMHGMIRTLTPNGLIMIRGSNFLKDVPDNLKLDFIETDYSNEKNLKLFKEFLVSKFKEKDLLQFYNVAYNGVKYDRYLEAEIVNLIELEEFGKKIENHFIKCINQNLMPLVKSSPSTDCNDEVHEFMVDCLVKQCTIKHKTYLKLFNSLTEKAFLNKEKRNSIYILSGSAGMGKSTILAYCAKKLKQISNFDCFFHNFSCTSNSMFNATVTDRLFRFLTNDTLNSDEPLFEKIKKLNELFVQGPKRQDKDVYYIFLDGIDEMSEEGDLQWIPKLTSHNIVIVMSCLIDSRPESFYSTLLKSEKFIKEIFIEPMEKDQLCKVVEHYLDAFGKKLSSEQMNILMNFENSNNPLWLISACEELRMHGYYGSLTNLIASLPSTISEINQMIIKRLLKQDTTNILKTFLQFLIISKYGLWENLIKKLLASKLNYTQSITHSLWLDIKVQLKGFLLIQTRSLPLIKFRHRVMKESIEKALEMDSNFQISLHKEMSLFFEAHLDETGNMFLSDYLYHLIKSNSRNRLINFMRSKRSWQVVNNNFIRGKIMLSIRCINLVSIIPQQKMKELMICNLCSNKIGDLSLFTPNKISCFFCGNVILGQTTETIKLFPCQFHRCKFSERSCCVLCENIFTEEQGESLKICHTCNTQNPNRKCGLIVKDNDILFHQNLKFSKSISRIDTII